MLRWALAIGICAIGIDAASAGQPAWPPPVPDLAVSVLPQADGCKVAEDCGLFIRIENLGGASYRGTIAVRETSNRGTTLGSPPPKPWTCSKLRYGLMACAARAQELAPGAHLDLELNVRFLPTPLAQSQDCASLDWSKTGAQQRKFALDSVTTALGRKAFRKTALAPLLASVFGGWGDGDIEGANDKNCVALQLGFGAGQVACAADEVAVNGTCVARLGMCTGGRDFDQATATCSCPAGQPDYDAALQACGGATASTPVCPMEAPFRNGKTKVCEAEPASQAKRK